MNYYDETLEKIKEYVDSKDYLSAKAIILEELKQVYIPSEFEKSLMSYMNIINENMNTSKSFSLNDIEVFLMKDNDHQLIAVEQLDKLNLREHIDLCDTYLKEGSFKNAKVLLIDSLIRQEIDYLFTYIDDGNTYRFNPKNLTIIEESDGFINAYKILDDYYMKGPSKFIMAKQLLYKDLLLALPVNYDALHGKQLAEKIIKFIDSAFDSAN